MSLPVEIESAWLPGDTDLMACALEQARTARGRVSPNPAVGAVVVHGGEIFAVGATQPPPGPHAEVVALTAAGEGARGADLYVTLEPCAHMGRTPPCVDAIIQAGIRRVVIATPDPHPLVNGCGIARLRAAGIRVDVGLETAAAKEVIAGFAHRIGTGRPRVTAKYAMTLDGRIATRSGHARWVSGVASRRHAHGVRDRTDAILVGIGTVLADDPELTTRLSPEESGYGGPHHPLPVVVDTHARTPPTARLLAPKRAGQALVLVGQHAPAAAIHRLQEAGAEVVSLPELDGRVDPHAVLQLLGARGVNEVLVEGGAALHGAFLDAQVVARLIVYLAPALVGGRSAPAAIGGGGVSHMSEAVQILDREILTLGDDLCLSGRVVYAKQKEVTDV